AADAAHAAFADPKSEFVAILRLWEAYRTAHEDMTQSQLRKWCDRSFLSFLRMREWRELHRQLKLQCAELGWAEEAARSVDAFARAPDARDAAGHRGGASASAPSPASRTAEPGRRRRRGRGARGDGAGGAGTGSGTDSGAGAGSGSTGERRQATDAPGASADLYQALHRALLAGLPTQVGHALPERDRRRQVTYEGPRGRRFQLFPGSSLASKPPPWLLSATLLDTEKVWALT